MQFLSIYLLNIIAFHTDGNILINMSSIKHIKKKIQLFYQYCRISQVPKDEFA